MNNPSAFGIKFHTAANAVKQVVYNPLWQEGGYFDHAIQGEHAPKLAVGEVVGCDTDDKRSMLLIGTELGNFVMFQRAQHNPEVFAWQCSPELCRFMALEGKVPDGAIDEALYDWVIGKDKNSDIGHLFQRAPADLREKLIGLYNYAPKPAAEAPAQEPVQAAAPETPKEAPKAASSAEAKPEAPKAETPHQSKGNEKMNATNNTKAQAAKPQLTGWGVFWRAAGIAVLIIALMAAVVFGLHFGAAYIAGLGMSAVVTTALTYFMTIAGHLGIGFAVFKGIGCLESLFARKAPAAPKAAPAAAAAA